MSALNFLPGVQVLTLDGGYAAKRIPNGKSVLIIGTSGKGPAETPYQVIDRATAASDFGNQGTMTQAMEEVAAYGDNVILYRMGTAAPVLSGIGATSGSSAGFTAVLGQRTADAGTRYKIWYNSGLLYLWLDNNLIYANDTGNGIVVDVLDSSISGTSTGGLPIGAQGNTARTLAGAITIAAATTLSASGQSGPPALLQAVTGLGMTARQTYLAQQNAFNLLSNYPVQEVFVPNAQADNPNVAFYVSNDSTTAGNNPATSVNALDWLQTTLDIYGSVASFHWASESVNSLGVSVAPATFTSAADRLAQGYSEVNFAYQLARFCQTQEEYLGGCLGFIGTSGPVGNKFDLVSVRNWIGLPPTYVNGTLQPTAPGKGLSGIPFLVGTTAGTLNSLCADAATGYRLQGMFKTDTGELDGAVQFDANQNPVDIGSYIHVVGDYAYLSTGVGTYTGSITGFVAGYKSILDEKSSLTNKNLANLTQVYRAGLNQLNALTFSGVNMLKFVAPGQPPVLLHGYTAATEGSDWHSMLRMSIKFLVISQLYKISQKYVGQSTNDGLTLQGLNTDLNAAMASLQKKGYIGTPYNLTISSTLAEQRIGQVDLAISFKPADELFRINATVAIKV